MAARPFTVLCRTLPGTLARDGIGRLWADFPAFPPCCWCEWYSSLLCLQLGLLWRGAASAIAANGGPLRMVRVVQVAVKLKLRAALLPPPLLPRRLLCLSWRTRSILLELPRMILSRTAPSMSPPCARRSGGGRGGARSALGGGLRRARHLEKSITANTH